MFSNLNDIPQQVFLGQEGADCLTGGATLSVTSFTAVQTEIEQHCHVHANTTGLGVVVSAGIIVHSTLVSVPVRGTGICISASLVKM